MWNTALAVNSCIWIVFAVFLVYSTGTLILQGAWHQFLYALLLFALANVSGAVIGSQC